MIIIYAIFIFLCCQQFPALKKPVNRSYFLSIENLTYERDGPASADDTASSVQSDAEVSTLIQYNSIGNPIAGIRLS